MRLDRIVVQKGYSALRLMRWILKMRRESGSVAAIRQLCRSIGAVAVSLRGGDVVRSEFDRAHGVDTSGTIRLAGLDIVSPNYKFGVFYKASHPEVVEALLKELTLPWEQFSFVDVGSGKGLVLLVASHFPFQRVTGVEFASELHRIAEQNIRGYHPAERVCQDVRSVAMDAVDYGFEETSGLVVYFYDPFSPPVLRAVMQRLEQSYRRLPRAIVIIYREAAASSVLNEEAAARREIFDRSLFARTIPASEANHSVHFSMEAAGFIGAIAESY